MKQPPNLVASVTLAMLTCGTIAAQSNPAVHFTVNPQVFDPSNTNLVFSDFLKGIGCPTGATVVPFVPPSYTTTVTSSYTDTACPTGDPQDNQNQGLLLVKTGPTNDNAAAGATIEGLTPKNLVLSELGYDIRKISGASDPRGSHCGAGAPRFNITTTDGTLYFVGCDSPPPTTQTGGTGPMYPATAPYTGGSEWLRLRWGNGTSGSVMGYNSSSGLLTPITGPIADHGIQIVFDEGQDTGPDYFGAAVLDNIDINGTLVGKK